jgi:predicted 3-demethylubiquinone-9 3-methyltransferase (glyoxalase superfamily)
MQKISPFLWFDTAAEEAAKHYTSIFKRSKITQVSRYSEGGPRPAGTVMTVAFELEGQTFTALNAGPEFKFTPAISFLVNVDDQAELDELNAKLIAGGGDQQPCGWATDRFGLSWQIVPRILGELMTDKDPARSGRVMKALMQMKKIDIAALKRAYEG